MPEYESVDVEAMVQFMTTGEATRPSWVESMDGRAFIIEHIKPLDRVSLALGITRFNGGVVMKNRVPLSPQKKVVSRPETAEQEAQENLEVGFAAEEEQEGRPTIGGEAKGQTATRAATACSSGRWTVSLVEQDASGGTERINLALARDAGGEGGISGPAGPGTSGSGSARAARASKRRRLIRPGGDDVAEIMARPKRSQKEPRDVRLKREVANSGDGSDREDGGQDFLLRAVVEDEVRTEGFGR